MIDLVVFGLVFIALLVIAGWGDGPDDPAHA